MNNYLQQQYRETKMKFDKFSARLQRSQENGEFQKMTRSKQNFLVNRVKRVWEKLRVLEVRLKISTVGAALACMMMVSNLNAQEQFVENPGKNPLPAPTIFGFDPFLTDIDNDGDLDLLASEDYDGIDLFLNKGTISKPEFERVPDENNPFNNIPEDLYFDTWDIIDSGDIDGDGDIDFLSDDGYIFRNTGSNANPVFEAEAFSGLSQGGSLADIDGDGDLDLILENNSGSVIYAYENIGDEYNFNLNLESDQRMEFTVSNWDTEISYIDVVEAVDVDGDGDFDLLVGVNIYSGYGYGGETVKYIRNTGSATAPAFSLENDANNPYSDLHTDELSFGDLDGDGDIDLLFMDFYAAGGIKYYEAQSNSIVENKVLVPEFYDGLALPFSYIPLQFVDYDGDGDFDAFSWGYSSDGYPTSLYFEYIETGQQLKYVGRPDIELDFIDESLYYQIPTFVDLDKDGDEDIVMLIPAETDTWDWKYYYLENTGSDPSPSYLKHEIPSLPVLDDPVLPYFADIDNDGDLDLFLTGDSDTASNYNDLATRYFESTGMGPLEFTERIGDANPLELLKEDNFVQLMYLAIPQFSDVDEDGDLDVVAVGYTEIYYLENTGSQSEAHYVDKSSAGPFSAIELVESDGCSINMLDVDNDGDDELFIHEIYGMLTRLFEKTSITNLAPTDISLSDNAVDEDQPVGTEVGTFTSTDPNAGDTHSYSLVTGDGSNDADNTSFTIDGAALKTAVDLDYETQSEYFIYVQTEDAGGETFSKAFTIEVTEAEPNQAPTDISLSAIAIDEDQPVGTAVGTFTSTDPDAGDTHSYSLVTGDGSNDADNASFTIDGAALKTAVDLDYEIQSEYFIYVQTEDAGGEIFSKAFTIEVTEVETNQAPTDISLSASVIEEDQPVGTAVGTLTSTDPDAGDTHSYSLVTGDGSNDADNASFTIDGTALKTAVDLNYETQSEYFIYVQTEDAGGLTFEKAFTVTVSDVTETGMEDADSFQAEVYPNPSEGRFLIRTSEQASRIEVFSLTGQKVVDQLVDSEIIDLDMSMHPSGTYYLKINLGETIYQARLVKL